MSCGIVFCGVVRCDEMWYRVLWCHVMSCGIVFCGVVRCDVMWYSGCGVMSCHVV